VGVSESLCDISVPLQFLGPVIDSLSLFKVRVSKAVWNAVSPSSRMKAWWAESKLCYLDAKRHVATEVACCQH